MSATAVVSGKIARQGHAGDLNDAEIRTRPLPTRSASRMKKGQMETMPRKAGRLQYHTDGLSLAADRP